MPPRSLTWWWRCILWRNLTIMTKVSSSDPDLYCLVLFCLSFCLQWKQLSWFQWTKFHFFTFRHSWLHPAFLHRSKKCSSVQRPMTQWCWRAFRVLSMLFPWHSHLSFICPQKTFPELKFILAKSFLVFPLLRRIVLHWQTVSVVSSL